MTLPQSPPQVLYNRYYQHGYDNDFLKHEIDYVILKKTLLSTEEFVNNLESRIKHFPHIERLENTYQFLTDTLDTLNILTNDI